MPYAFFLSLVIRDRSVVYKFILIFMNHANNYVLLDILDQIL